VIRRITALVFAISLVPAAAVLADDIGGSDVIMIEKEEAVIAEEPVTAPPPPFVEIEQTAIGAGIGARFGGGTLLVEGEEHSFKLNGVSLGDLGVSKISASGHVLNLNDISDFEGNYVALEAAAALGKGGSTVTMRNQKGVEITLHSDVTGLQLTLGAETLNVELD